MKLKDLDIVIISPEPWGVNFVSKHHYAQHLARLENRVFFINPPSSINSVRQESENLKVLDYKPILRGINQFPAMMRRLFERTDINRIKTRLGLAAGPDIVWSFDPFRFQDAELWKSGFIIYHAADVHKINLERHLASKSNLILAPSDRILDRFDGINVPKHKIGHGVAEQFFSPIANTESGNPSGRPKIGYVGNLHYQYIDAPILKAIVQKNTGCDFHFFGPYAGSNLSRSQINLELIRYLQSQQHCRLWGPVEQRSLPGTIGAMDAFLMCYSSDRSYVAELSNSHKVLEMLSTGKVVICHYIDEYRDKRQLLEMTDRTSELPQRFLKTIENLGLFNTPEKQRMRRDYAAQNSYNQQIERIQALINSIA